MNTIDYFGQLINYLRNLKKYWIKDIYIYITNYFKLKLKIRNRAFNVEKSCKTQVFIFEVINSFFTKNH